MRGYRDHVLKVLPRLNMSNIDSMIRRLGDPNLLFTSIRWADDSEESAFLPVELIAEFFLCTYTFDWSARDGTGANALIAAAKKDMAGVVRLILEKNEDSLNYHDHSGRTAVSWAAEKGKFTLSVLLGYKGARLELMESEGFDLIDYFLEGYWNNYWENMIPVLPLMIPLLEHGINNIDKHGCTLLHDLIEVTATDRGGDEPFGYYKHWEALTSYQGRNLFESRIKENDDRQHRKAISYFKQGVQVMRSPRLDVSDFRQALGAVSVSAAEVRTSPCKCGIGTVFLAISTGNVGLVEVLLDFYPDLVNDEFFDGSSPLDLASYIPDQQRRQSMSDLILSRNPNI